MAQEQFPTPWLMAPKKKEGAEAAAEAGQRQQRDGRKVQVHVQEQMAADATR